MRWNSWFVIAYWALCFLVCACSTGAESEPGFEESLSMAVAELTLENSKETAVPGYAPRLTSSVPSSCPAPGTVQPRGDEIGHEDYMLGCFPCCFCCNKGSCCDECKERNKLKARESGEP